MYSKILKVNNICKKFISGPVEHTALDKISFSMNKGEVICIVGPSGSGKSTLLRVLAGLERLDTGDIQYGCSKTEMVFVSQDYNLWPHKTVYENISLSLKSVHHLYEDQIEKDVNNLLRAFSMLEKKDAYPASLSGGQKQRVALIRAIAVKPKLLLLDEITSSLDPLLVDSVLEIVKVLAKNNNSMIIVTHQIKFATEIADRIFFMKNGQLVQDCTSADFIYNQTNTDILDFTKELHINKQDVKVHKGYDQFQAFQLGTLNRFKKGSSKCVVGSSGDRWFECMGEYYEEYEKKRMQRNISWKMIMQEESELDKDLRLRLPEINEYRILPKNMQNPANYYVIEDSVVIQIFKTEDGEPMIIEIKNDAVAHSYKQYFDLLWSLSKKVS